MYFLFVCSSLVIFFCQLFLQTGYWVSWILVLAQHDLSYIAAFFLLSVSVLWNCIFYGSWIPSKIHQSVLFFKVKVKKIFQYEPCFKPVCNCLILNVVRFILKRKMKCYQIGCNWKKKKKFLNFSFQFCLLSITALSLFSSKSAYFLPRQRSPLNHFTLLFLKQGECELQKLLMIFVLDNFGLFLWSTNSLLALQVEKDETVNLKTHF